VLLPDVDLSVLAQLRLNRRYKPALQVVLTADFLRSAVSTVCEEGGGLYAKHLCTILIPDGEPLSWPLFHSHLLVRSS
jgi:hypothetical protein